MNQLMARSVLSVRIMMTVKTQQSQNVTKGNVFAAMMMIIVGIFQAAKIDVRSQSDAWNVRKMIIVAEQRTIVGQILALSVKIAVIVVVEARITAQIQKSALHAKKIIIAALAISVLMVSALTVKLIRIAEVQALQLQSVPLHTLVHLAKPILMFVL